MQSKTPNFALSTAIKKNRGRDVGEKMCVRSADNLLVRERRGAIGRERQSCLLRAATHGRHSAGMATISRSLTCSDAPNGDECVPYGTQHGDERQRLER